MNMHRSHTAALRLRVFVFSSKGAFQESLNSLPPSPSPSEALQWSPEVISEYPCWLVTWRVL